MSMDIQGFPDKGVVEVKLHDKVQPWKIVYEPNSEEMEIISRVYCERNIIERNKRRGLLVVIHGLMTNAGWLSNLTPAANSQGWIVAPFIYENPPTLLFDKGGRLKVIEQFFLGRMW